MAAVDVLVRSYPRGEQIVQVDERDILGGAWRTLAMMAAAAAWGCSFTAVAANAKIGLRRQDLERLKEQAGRRDNAKEEETQ